MKKYAQYLQPSNNEHIKNGEDVSDGIQTHQLTQYGLKSAIASMIQTILQKESTEETKLWAINMILLYSHYLSTESTKDLIQDDWHWLIK
jgi:hypothetical protein